jgi:hypothetical protein
MARELDPREQAVLECHRTEIALEAALETLRKVRAQLEGGEIEAHEGERFEFNSAAAAMESAPVAPVAPVAPGPHLRDASAQAPLPGDDPEVPGKRRRTCGTCHHKRYGVRAGVCPGCVAPKTRAKRRHRCTKCGELQDTGHGKLCGGCAAKGAST